VSQKKTMWLNFIEFISFHECLRHRHLQPAAGILFCFVEAQQAAIQFCERTRVDNVLHGLLLSAITEWRWRKTLLMHFSTTWALALFRNGSTVSRNGAAGRNHGCWIVGSHTRWLLTTAADNQSSSHCTLWSTVVVSAQIGRRATSRFAGRSNT